MLFPLHRSVWIWLSLICHFQSVVEIDRNSLSINTKRPTLWLLNWLWLKYIYPNHHHLPGKGITCSTYGSSPLSTTSQSAWALRLTAPLKHSFEELTSDEKKYWKLGPISWNILQETSLRGCYSSVLGATPVATLEVGVTHTLLQSDFAGVFITIQLV